MSKTVLAIDPGPEKSGWVLFDGERVLQHGHWPNEEVLVNLASPPCVCDFACESIAYYGKKVGREVFDTCFWIGRFTQALLPAKLHLISRPQVNLAICHCKAGDDKSIQAALKFRFGPVGTKKAPGPLYGVTSHAWAALGVAVTYLDGKGNI